MKRPSGQGGFTLVEVLIALAITGFVATIAYTSLASVMNSLEVLRGNADRSYEVNRAWMILSRDLREFANRPVRDEFGEVEPALTGGEAARFPLSFTRLGWHNPNAYPRSNLQRVNYRLEDEALWRDIYYVLDRAGSTEPESVKLLDGVEYMDISFLGALDQLQVETGGTTVDTRNWPDSWVADYDQGAGGDLAPPAALEITLQLTDWGEMRRIYALPPL
jgi:general secretion pathway protein J